MSEETSLSLLQKLNADDGLAWQVFLERYRPLLLAYLKNFGLQAADAEDLMQEVLMVLHRELPKFERRRTGSLRTWIREVMRLRCLEFSRRRDRTAGSADIATLGDGLADERSHVSRQLDQDHEQFILARIMEEAEERFEPQTWQAFRRVTDGESIKVVAADLQMTPNAVTIAKSRVLSALRRAAAEFLD